MLILYHMTKRHLESRVTSLAVLLVPVTFVVQLSQTPKKVSNLFLFP